MKKSIFTIVIFRKIYRLAIVICLYNTFYFPMQNLEKMVPKTSSVVTSPVIVPK